MYVQAQRDGVKYNEKQVQCTLYIVQREAQSVSLARHACSVYTLGTYFTKPMKTTQCSFEFSKMTTEGAGRTQISTRGFQLKKGKI